MIDLSTTERSTLEQLWAVTYDGCLISKAARDALVDRGFAVRGHGYQWLTEKGIKAVIEIWAARGYDPIPYYGSKAWLKHSGRP